MLSTTEEIYIKGLIVNYYDNGYKNYLCQTNNPNNSYNQSYYDVICYFSRGSIEKNNNNYEINGTGKRCNIDTKNTTSTNKLNSLTCADFNGTINIEQKEFVYSNSMGESNLIGEYTTQKFLNESIIIIMTMIFLYYWITKLFKTRRNINE